MTSATVVVSLLSTALPASSAAFASLSFGFTDAAGKAATPVVVVPAATDTSATATFDTSASAAGSAVFTCSALDANGAVIGSVISGSATLGVVVPPVMYPAPQSPLTITLA